jgi:hypothetical protein
MDAENWNFEVTKNEGVKFRSVGWVYVIKKLFLEMYAIIFEQAFK